MIKIRPSFFDWTKRILSIEILKIILVKYFILVLSEMCRLPKESGPCYADFLRFYFDDSIGECRPFNFGGCQGNQNNFETQQECYEQCGRDNVDYKIVTQGYILFSFGQLKTGLL